MKLQTNKINEIVNLLTGGMESIVKAGEIWVSILDENPDKSTDLYNEIPKKYPLLSVDKLITLERLGRRDLMPELVFDESPASKSIRLLPYSQQQQCLSGPIDVAVHRAGKIVKEKRNVKDLSRREVSIAIGPKGVRPLDEQERLWSFKVSPVQPAKYEHRGSVVKVFRSSVFTREEIQKILEGFPKIEEPQPITGKEIEKQMKENQLKTRS